MGQFQLFLDKQPEAVFSMTIFKIAYISLHLLLIVGFSIQNNAEQMQPNYSYCHSSYLFVEPPGPVSSSQWVVK